MTLDFKYDIGNRVMIKELNLPGRVIGLYIARRGIEYQVRYWCNAKHEDTYFEEDELTLIKEDV